VIQRGLRLERVAAMSGVRLSDAHDREQDHQRASCPAPSAPLPLETLVPEPIRVPHDPLSF
jgi:hypothetical protein